MPLHISHGTAIPASNNTESLLSNAFNSASSKRIIQHPLFLNDENLPEAERISVLQEVFHRNIRLRQLERLAKYLWPALAGEIPQNLLIYGPSGTGKSVTCLHFLSTLAAMCQKRKVRFSYCYVDLTTPRTCFGALNQLAIALDSTMRRYKKGIPLDHIQERIIESLNEKGGMIGILVDEADNVSGDSDHFFTFLAKTLPRKVTARLFYVFLTNRLEWERGLDPRILSVLKKTDLIFEPYDAMDLVEILNLRVEKALNPEKVDSGAIRKIAAYASRETGDARKAVELLVKAVKIAEENSGYLGEKEVDEADRVLEVDKTQEMIQSLAWQQRMALLACYVGLQGRVRRISTGQAYLAYSQLCERQGSRPLTQRRFSDMVSFLDLYGLVSARVISKGRYGKTRELSTSLPSPVIEDLLKRGTC